MKRINDIRIINADEHHELLGMSGTYVNQKMVGYYEHNGKIYRYAGSNSGTAYFVLHKDSYPTGLGEELEKGWKTRRGLVI